MNTPINPLTDPLIRDLNRRRDRADRQRVLRAAFRRAAYANAGRRSTAHTSLPVRDALHYV